MSVPMAELLALDRHSLILLFSPWFLNKCPLSIFTVLVGTGHEENQHLSRGMFCTLLLLHASQWYLVGKAH